MNSGQAQTIWTGNHSYRRESFQAVEKASHFGILRYLSLLINTTGHRNKLQRVRKKREKTFWI